MNDGLSAPIPARAGAFSGKLANAREFFAPVRDAPPLHAAVAASVLVLDAILVLAMPASATGVLSTSPPIYLVFPAAASVYLALASLSDLGSAVAVKRRTTVRLVTGVALVWALLMVGFVVLSAGPAGWTLVLVARSPWLYSGCLVGVALPTAALWLSRDSPEHPSWIGFALVVPPPLLGLVARLPGFSPMTTVLLTATTLIASAVFCLLAGLYVGSTSTPIPPEGSGAASRGEGGHVVPFRPLSTRPTSGIGPALSPSFAVPTTANQVLPARADPGVVRGAGRWPNVVSTGFGWLDEVFLGGFPRYGQLGILSEAEIGGENVLWGTVSAALRRNETVVIVTGLLPASEVAERIEQFSPGFKESERRGAVLWVDASGQTDASAAGVSGALFPWESVSILSSLLSATKRAEERSENGFCLAFAGVTAFLEALGAARGATFLRNVVGILRERPVIALYSIEFKGRPNPGAAPLLNEIDGALLFRSENLRTWVKVLRYEPVESRGWVECRLGDPALPATREPPASAGGSHDRRPAP